MQIISTAQDTEIWKEINNVARVYIHPGEDITNTSGEKPLRESNYLLEEQHSHDDDDDGRFHKIISTLMFIFIQSNSMQKQF